ncbi:hypothetical protein Tco_0056186, partial [Tanacetum coccineum]
HLLGKGVSVRGKTGWKKTDNAFGALDIPFGRGAALNPAGVVAPRPQRGEAPPRPPPAEVAAGPQQGALPLDPARGRNPLDPCTYFGDIELASTSVHSAPPNLTIT